MKRRVTPLFLTLAMLLTLLTPLLTLSVQAVEAWDGEKAAEYAGGSGMRDDPYLIESANQLALFRDQVNEGQSEICAKVVADLDLNNIPWQPIGLTQSGYIGIFDGGGWAIRNLRINNLSDSVVIQAPNGKKQELRAAGLFGVIGASGVVKYVNVDGEVTGTVTSQTGVGVYVGTVAGMNFGVVEECFSTCAYRDFGLASNNFMGLGGIVGLNQEIGEIKNCYYIGRFQAALYSSNENSNYQYLGGIVGYTYGTVSNCYVVAEGGYSTNSQNLYRGAIAGLSYRTGNVVNCCFDIDVCSWTGYVMGASYGSLTAKNPSAVGKCKKNTEEMKSEQTIEDLGGAYRYDYDNVNDGYPVLAVMAYGEEAKEDSWYTAELKASGVTEEELQELVPTALWNKDLTKNVTRAEFASIAVNLYELLSGETVTVEIDNPFTDTSNDDIIKAYQLGITNGASESTFAPYSSIARQDMAAMLTRVYKKLYIPDWSLATDPTFQLDYEMPELFLDDGQISSYARNSVYFMTAEGVLKGANGYFYPVAATDRDTVGNATREQAIITSIRYYSANK